MRDCVLVIEDFYEDEVVNGENADVEQHEEKIENDLVKSN